MPKFSSTPKDLAVEPERITADGDTTCVDDVFSGLTPFQSGGRGVLWHEPGFEEASRAARSMPPSARALAALEAWSSDSEDEEAEDVVAGATKLKVMPAGDCAAKAPVDTATRVASSAAAAAQQQQPQPLVSRASSAGLATPATVAPHGRFSSQLEHPVLSLSDLSPALPDATPDSGVVPGQGPEDIPGHFHWPHSLVGASPPQAGAVVERFLSHGSYASSGSSDMSHLSPPRSVSLASHDEAETRQVLGAGRQDAAPLSKSREVASSSTTEAGQHPYDPQS